MPEFLQRKLFGIVVGVVLLASVIILWLQFRSVPVNFNRSPIIGMGQVAAEITAQTLQDKGRVLVIVPGIPGSSEKLLPPNGLWNGFEDEIKKHSGISIVATEFADIDRGGFPAVSATSLQAILEHHRDADAVVVFNGLPLWEEMRDFIQQKAPFPKIIVVDIDMAPLKRRYAEYFSSGFLQQLVSLRVERSSGSTASPKTPREWFDSQYRVYGPADVAALVTE